MPFYTDYKGFEVEVKMSHSSDIVDSYIEAVYFAETGEQIQLTEDEYTELEKLCAEKIAEDHLDWNIGRAEDAMERDFERHWGGYACFCSKCDGNSEDHI